MRHALVPVALAVLAGCMGPEQDKVPGDSLGTYQVVAQLDSSTCGPGALGSKDLWEFEVKLSRDGHDLYWVNGADPIGGDVASDGVSFGFDSHAVLTPIKPAKGQPGCSISRTDSGTGKLSSAAPPVAGFEGTLRYGFKPVGESDCEPLMAVEGGFSQLPCEISYSMDATRQGD
ncbi:MAG: hypothetical protein HYZ29_11735 [Myxococcales bacterium]|nr:hypothetical protein [Myxococcales bacterium]